MCSQASFFLSFHLIHLPNQIKLLLWTLFCYRGAKGSHQKSLPSTWGLASWRGSAETNLTGHCDSRATQGTQLTAWKTSVKFPKVKYSKPTVWLWCTGNLHKSAQAYKILFSYFPQPLVPQQTDSSLHSLSCVILHCTKAQWYDFRQGKTWVELCALHF